ncbi:MAG: CinA family protein [Deltaproteobacteria bacterium]|nr:CinA family protein [Deltaproteobacteria bacterium]
MMPEHQLADLLLPRSRWLAVAESCTGGLLAHRITNVPGSSRYFDRGLVTYSNRAKMELLGVPAALLERHGAVSAEVAAAMVEGLCRAAGVAAGVAVTGIAGPGGGSEAKPVGLVYLAVQVDGELAVARHQFAGSRLEIKNRTADEALRLLVRRLRAGETMLA